MAFLSILLSTSRNAYASRFAVTFTNPSATKEMLVEETQFDCMHGNDPAFPEGNSKMFKPDEKFSLGLEAIGNRDAPCESTAIKSDLG